MNHYFHFNKPPFFFQLAAVRLSLSLDAIIHTAIAASLTGRYFVWMCSEKIAPFDVLPEFLTCLRLIIQSVCTTGFVLADFTGSLLFM